ncbi:hypothetical protein L228DRAFT_242123 [Xylona heveae TC161]|uniref:VPS9 domain-containing protein n=1 Tax=Xylona heveae (strain CBS 132557 / TC161) TaxID=1328760 RepID=A0A164Z8J9_XYLHT|nr:hypothetical protein L228DRAFT_242123 [Xylona heveae TC161]KZF18818.1 hypothetical protein L228DRAFT_242123 [Xylona heveae TC161]
MHPLNPFLRAFFRSTLPAQCAPVQHHILLVPTTEVLLSTKDRDSNALYADLATSEDFLGSHVLRIPEGSPTPSGKENGPIRDGRGKPKQFTTVNGRTVVVKDTFVYSFKHLNQAQLLQDVVYYPDTLEPQQWLIYYISKPLVGSPEPVAIMPALVPDSAKPLRGADPKRTSLRLEGTSALPRKKDIKSFNDLLNQFPMIARQMHPGLERLFREFKSSVEKPLPNPPTGSASSISSRRRSSSSSAANSVMSAYNALLSGQSDAHLPPSAIYLEEDEDELRAALETAVTAAIDLFQLVDKQQLSLLGATTDLTGPLVEKQIERYVSEQLHDPYLFPRICSVRRSEDIELESHIRHMVHVDISQVGIPIGNDHEGKKELILRLGRGVEEFRKMGVAGSPQEMMDVLLATEKTITRLEAQSRKEDGTSPKDEEKRDHPVTISADTLVSLLLVVVIRAQVRHLFARLSYMRHFIFVDDVESGEMGYALSTFEAVLVYLAKDAGGLRRASRLNKRLWDATRNGRVSDMRAILEPEAAAIEEMKTVEEPEEIDEYDSAVLDHTYGMNGNIISSTADSVPQPLSQSSEEVDDPEISALAHVFPFQASRNAAIIESRRPRVVKHVSMDTRSLSSSSGYSFHSRSTTMDSTTSNWESDTSIEKLSMTQDSSGQSTLMMAVESRQTKGLRYLLSLEEYYPLDFVLSDTNNEGTTLLSAAVQLGDVELIDTLLDTLFKAKQRSIISSYLQKQDFRGRGVGHYLFNAPHLITRLGTLISWTQRDRNGQTPLFALCRSYDHSEYRSMVEAGLAAANEAQGDDEPLHLDDHLDAKGNTLLHIVSDPYLTVQILYHCDSDANATNDKRFTPLMVASKFGRIDMVRAFFGDPRVDIYAKELRGLTAVELAKDDDVRNQIDDLTLFSHQSAVDGRITAVVRSFFVDDSSIRLIVKSGAPSSDSTFTVTTCRRSLTDFENLAKWLSVEQPASWLPSISNFRSPYQLPSKPSRAILRDIQIRLDSFLKILLAHTNFSTHEMLWEFFLVPDIQPEMMAERSKRKAAARAEDVMDEYPPVEDTRDVETFVGHARELVRGMNHSTRSVLRRSNKMRTLRGDLFDAQELLVSAFSTLPFLPQSHLVAFNRLIASTQQPELSPEALFFYDFQSIASTIQAVLVSLSRPHMLIENMAQTSKIIDRHLSSLRRSDRWPLGLLDDTRNKVHQDAADKVINSRRELARLGAELRYTQQTVAAELAGWQELHEKMGRRAIRQLARRTLVSERARLEAMKRAVRGCATLREESQRARG